MTDLLVQIKLQFLSYLKTVKCSKISHASVLDEHCEVTGLTVFLLSVNKSEYADTFYLLYIIDTKYKQICFWHWLCSFYRSYPLRSHLVHEIFRKRKCYIKQR